MAQKLTNLKVNEVSLVDKGAIGEVFTIIKRANPEVPAGDGKEPVAKEDQGEKGLKALLTNFVKAASEALGITSPIAKKAKTSFTEQIQAKELRDTFYDAFWALDDVAWAIMNDETIVDKPAALKAAASEFATYLQTKLDTVDIEKSAEVRMDLMQNIQKSMNKKEDDEGMSFDMDAFTKAMQSAMQPIADGIADLNKRLDGVETAKAANAECNTEPAETESTEPVGKNDPVPAASNGPSMDDIVAAIGKAMEPLTTQMSDVAKRVQALEETEQPSAVAKGQEVGGEPVQKRWPSFNLGS